MPQTDLYTSYVLRFSAPSPTEDSPAPEQSNVTSLQQAEGQFDLSNLDDHNQENDADIPASTPAVHRRLLNPVEMITLTRMTFPHCEPVVDENGKFVIRGIERREGVEKGWVDKSNEMFPFALMTGKLLANDSSARANMKNRDRAIRSIHSLVYSSGNYHHFTLQVIRVRRRHVRIRIAAWRRKTRNYWMGSGVLKIVTSVKKSRISVSISNRQLSYLYIYISSIMLYTYIYIQIGDCPLPSCATSLCVMDHSHYSSHLRIDQPIRVQKALAERLEVVSHQTLCVW